MKKKKGKNRTTTRRKNKEEWGSLLSSAQTREQRYGVSGGGGGSGSVTGGLTVARSGSGHGPRIWFKAGSLLGSLVVCGFEVMAATRRCWAKVATG